MKSDGIEKKCCFSLIFALVFMSYCVYLPSHYGTDGLATESLYRAIDNMEYGRTEAIWNEAVFSGFSAGRFTRGILFSLIALFGKAQWLTSWWMNFFAIVMISLSAYTAWKTIKEINGALSICSFFCILIAFCQPFFTDWFQFTECQLFHSIGLFIAIHAARIALTGRISTAKKYIASSVLLTVCSGLYQNTMQWFVWMAMAIVICYATARQETSAKDAAKSASCMIAFSLSIYVVAAAVQLFFTQVIFCSPRVGGAGISLHDKIEKLVQAQKELWLMTPYTKNQASSLFFVVCLVVLGASTISIFRKHAHWGIKAIWAAVIVICTFGFYASILLPIFVTESWYCQRSVVGFWGIPFLLSLAVPREKISNRGFRVVEMVPATVGACMIAVNIISCLQFGSDLHRINAMDAMRAQSIEEQIRTYEEQSNGVQVQYLAFHYDRNPTYCYPQIRNSHDNNQSAWTARWNWLPIMNLTNGKSYEQSEYSDELFYERYGEKNWNAYSQEQVFFVDDTAYIALY